MTTLVALPEIRHAIGKLCQDADTDVRRFAEAVYRLCQVQNA